MVNVGDDGDVAKIFYHEGASESLVFSEKDGHNGNRTAEPVRGGAVYSNKKGCTI
jgi:hypothetical protein